MLRKECFPDLNPKHHKIDHHIQYNIVVSIVFRRSQGTRVEMVVIIDGEILPDDDPRVQRMKKGPVNNSHFNSQSATLRGTRPTSQGE